MKNYTIDAQGKMIGRVASQAAIYLMGKNSVKYARNLVPEVKVAIINCGKANITSKKMQDKKYVTFTGYRGGINTETLSDLIERKDTTEAFKRAVTRMLPSNSLRKAMLKNLTITE